MIVDLDGSLVEASRAALPIHDAGLRHGDGIFTALRVERGRAHRFDDHLERLRHDAAELGIAVDFTPGPWRRRVDAVLAANQLHASTARVRIQITRGTVDPRAVFDDPRTTPASLIEAFAMAEPDPERVLGVLLLRPGVGCRALPHLKTTSYLPSVLAMRRAREADCDEALVRDAAGRVLEGAASNLFLVRAGALCTPPVSAGILPGIVRARVIALAEALGVEVEERPVEVDELFAADELFVTNAVRGLRPVGRVVSTADGATGSTAAGATNSVTVGNGRRGPVTRALQDALREEIAAEPPLVV